MPLPSSNRCANALTFAYIYLWTFWCHNWGSYPGHMTDDVVIFTGYPHFHRGRIICPLPKIVSKRSVSLKLLMNVSSKFTHLQHADVINFRFLFNTKSYYADNATPPRFIPKLRQNHKSYGDLAFWHLVEFNFTHSVKFRAQYRV